MYLLKIAKTPPVFWQCNKTLTGERINSFKYIPSPFLSIHKCVRAPFDPINQCSFADVIPDHDIQFQHISRYSTCWKTAGKNQRDMPPHESGFQDGICAQAAPSHHPSRCCNCAWFYRESDRRDGAQTLWKRKDKVRQLFYTVGLLRASPPQRRVGVVKLRRIKSSVKYR